ncbi:MAG: ATPase [Planctomycetaceae bacterium]|nr:ATPase [Planctomycetaceae bacterium]
MSPSDIVEVLTAVIPTRQPTYLWGPPGCGKSSLVRQVSDSLGLEFLDLRASQLDPVDLRGLPKVENGKTVWCQPTFLPSSGNGVLLLDELAQAPPLVQSAFFQLVLDRRLGEYVLPEGWSVLAASNRIEDRAGAGRVNCGLTNRFLHLDLDVCPDSWHAWALANDIAPEVRAFIRFRPALLHSFDPSTNPRAFASPRSWEFVSRVFRVTPPNQLHQVVAGCVSSGPAAEFMAFLQLYTQLPDIDAVLKSPTTCHLPSKEPAVMFALIGALLQKCKADRTLVGNFTKLALRLPDEFGVMAIRDAIALDRSLVANPDVQRWLASARTKGLFVAA